MLLSIVTDESREAGHPNPRACRDELAVETALRRLGHTAVRLDASRLTAADLGERLRTLTPDAVVILARSTAFAARAGSLLGVIGAAGVPGLTVSAAAHVLLADKRTTKHMVAAHGVPTPRWQFVRHVTELDVRAVSLPAIIKPNWGSNSSGIAQASVVTRPDDLLHGVARALALHPAGVLVEAYIDGRDVVVPVATAVAPSRDGVLTPMTYRVASRPREYRRFAILDEIAAATPERVEVDAAALSQRESADLEELAHRATSALDLAPVGQLEFRVSPWGQVFFIEAEPFPDVARPSALGYAAALEGLGDPAGLWEVLLKAVIDARPTAAAYAWTAPAAPPAIASWPETDAPPRARS